MTHPNLISRILASSFVLLGFAGCIPDETPDAESPPSDLGPGVGGASEGVGQTGSGSSDPGLGSGGVGTGGTSFGVGGFGTGTEGGGTGGTIANGPAKITCVGDSITENDNSWIYPLQDALRAAGCNYELTGWDHNQMGESYATREGYDNQRIAKGGFSTTGILNLINEFGMGSTPDVFVEYLGVNNVYGGWIDGTYNPDNSGDPSGSYIRDNKEMIRLVREQNPNAVIVLMKIQDGQMPQIDEAIDSLVASESTAQSPVIAVNSADGVDTSDGIHPTDDGAVTLAGPVSDALADLLMERGYCGGTAGGGDTLDAREVLLDGAPGSLSEAPPSGVPSNWSWVVGAEVGDLKHPAPYTHVNFWGAVFRGESNTTPSNTEVQIADTQMWVIYEGGSDWTLIQGQTPPHLGGASFSPQYGGGSGDPILRHTNEGAFVVPNEGDIWHFWYGDGYQPSDNNIREMLVVSKVRLVLRNPGGVDDRDSADYLVHLGADMRDPSDPDCSNDAYICPSFGVGKFYQITNEFRVATFHSVTQADLDGGLPLPPASVFTLPE